GAGLPDVVEDCERDDGYDRSEDDGHDDNLFAHPTALSHAAAAHVAGPPAVISTSIAQALELAIELIALRRHVLLEPLQPALELPVAVPQRAERRVRLGADASPHLLLVLVEHRPHRSRLLRQEQRHDQVADDDERAREAQGAERDEHADGRHGGAGGGGAGGAYVDTQS